MSSKSASQQPENCKNFALSAGSALLAKSVPDRCPFQLSGGAIPDAAAIYAARKRREAAREGKTGSSASPAPNAGSKDYLPINQKQRWDQSVHFGQSTSVQIEGLHGLSITSCLYIPCRKAAEQRQEVMHTQCSPSFYSLVAQIKDPTELI